LVTNCIYCVLSAFSDKRVHEEATSLEATQQECKEDTIHKEAAETLGNEAEKTSADTSLNCEVLLESDQQQGVRMSTRKRKPPVKLSKDFL
jgi:hypothetical protein